jgi:hypothetical protein
MAEEGLKIKIGADVQSAITSLNNLNNSLAKTNDSAVKVGSSGMQSVTKGANQATFALTNFSRIASDAPFGLIGIANNIDPLVQSFIALRKETGSGKAAFQSLLTSLSGGGGLIVGVSVLTSVLQFAQLGFSRWGESAKDAKNKTSDLNKETKTSVLFQQQFFYALKDITTEVAKEAANVTILIKTLKTETTTREERNNAIKELNKISPELFKNLSSEKIEIDNLNSAYQKYINSIQGRVRLQLLESQLQDVLKQELFLTDQNNAAIKFATTLEKNRLDQSRKAGELNIQFERRTQNLLSIDKELLKVQKDKLNITNRIIAEQEDYNKKIKTNKEDQDKGKQNIDEIANLLKQYNEQLKGINWDEQNRQIDGTKKRLELAGETLKTLYLAGVKETSAAWIRVKADFDQFQSAFDKFVRDNRLAEINKGVQEYTNNIGSYTEKALGETQKKVIKALNETGKLFLENYKAQQKGLSDLQKKNEELANTISGFLSPALESVFEAVVKGEDPFEVLQNSVKQLVIELGKAVIKSLILKAVTSAIGGPAGGAAVSGTGLATMRGDVFSFLLSRGR